MEIFYERGIVVGSGQTRIYLDPEISSVPLKHTILVTHAHSDHTAGITGAAKTYLTETTLKLFERTNSRYPKNFSYIEYYEPMEVGPFEIEFIPAGHLLGAAQIIVREGNSSFLYTGDFCPEPLLTVGGAEFPQEQFDVVVMDATYGDNLIKFNDRQSSRQSLFIWVISQINAGKIPIINVGHLGGAQELIRLFNQLAGNLPVIVDEKIHQVSKVFQENGVPLDYFTFDDPNIEQILEDKCLVLMPRSFKKFKGLEKKYELLKGKTIRAIVTGQTAKFGYNSFNFASALSTHANYQELLDTAKLLQPKHIMTHYGYAEKLAQSFMKKLSITAQSVLNSKPLDFDALTSNFIQVAEAEKKHPSGYKSLDLFF